MVALKRGLPKDMGCENMFQLLRTLIVNCEKYEVNTWGLFIIYSSGGIDTQCARINIDREIPDQMTNKSESRTIGASIGLNIETSHSLTIQCTFQD
jgi:hypothetical protein